MQSFIYQLAQMAAHSGRGNQDNQEQSGNEDDDDHDTAIPPRGESVEEVEDQLKLLLFKVL